MRLTWVNCLFCQQVSALPQIIVYEDYLPPSLVVLTSYEKLFTQWQEVFYFKDELVVGI